MDRYPVLIKLIAGCAFILLDSRIHAAEPEKAKPKPTVENVGNGVGMVLKGFFGEVPSVEKLQGQWKLEISVKLTKPPEQGPAPKVVEPKKLVAPEQVAGPVPPPATFIPPEGVPLQVCPPKPEKPSIGDKLKDFFKPKPAPRYATGKGIGIGFQTWTGGMTLPSPQSIERSHPQYYPPVENTTPPPPPSFPIAPAPQPITPAAPLQRGSYGVPNMIGEQVSSGTLTGSGIGAATGALIGATLVPQAAPAVQKQPLRIPLLVLPRPQEDPNKRAKESEELRQELLEIRRFWYSQPEHMILERLNNGNNLSPR